MFVQPSDRPPEPTQEYRSALAECASAIIFGHFAPAILMVRRGYPKNQRRKATVIIIATSVIVY